MRGEERCGCSPFDDDDDDQPALLSSSACSMCL